MSKLTCGSMLRLYRAVDGSVALALVVQLTRSRAGCYTGPSVCDRVERGPGVDGSWCVRREGFWIEGFSLE